MSTGPTFKYGDMFQETWNKPGTLFMVTTNSTVNRNGKLVMGRGAAKELALRLGGIEKLLGRAVTERGPEYHLLVITDTVLHEVLGHWHPSFCDVGIFQVKHHFKDKAEPALIEKAAKALAEYAKNNRNQEINLNMPGTGCGLLSEAAVLPLLQCLPSKVNIWRRAYEAPRKPSYEPSSDDQGQ